MCILILVDSPAQHETRDILSDSGFDVAVAESLSEFASSLREPGIDAILLDISQTDSQCLDLFQNMRALSHDLPIVVFSVNDDKAEALEFIRNGAQDYLVKGVASREALQRCLEYSIERN